MQPKQITPRNEIARNPRKSTLRTTPISLSTSDWLKAAVRSALECDPADVMRDAQTLVTLERISAGLNRDSPKDWRPRGWLTRVRSTPESLVAPVAMGQFRTHAPQQKGR